MTVVVAKGGTLRAAKAWPLAGTDRGGVRHYTASSLDLAPLALSASYAEIYRSQPWVYVVVNKLARGIARLPLKAYRLDPESGDRERVRDHPLPRLLARPHPGGSAFTLKEAIIGSLAIYGNALLAKWRPARGGAPAELWPVNWRYVTPVSGTTRPIEHYEYRGPAGRILFLPEDVVHFRWWSPEGRGVSPLEPLRRTLAMEEAGQRYAINAFVNGARPSGAITGVRDEQREELRAQLRAWNEGPENAARIALLSAGLDWKPFSHTAQEAEAIAHRKLNREEVAAAYDMPPPAIQILDRATFSNVTEQHRMLYMDTYGPPITLVEETYWVQLIEDEPAFADTFVEFDLSEVLKADLPARAAAYRQLETTLTMNERRQLENRPRIEHPAADAVLLPLNMVAIGEGMDPLEEQVAKRSAALDPLAGLRAHAENGSG